MQVSVIIPTYNSAEKIQKCIEGLENQSLPREQYEIIVVDDGSTDETALIKENDTIHYYFQENRGPAAARNRGVELAKGNIVLFTDSDCIPDRDWIEQMVSPFQDLEIAAVKGTYKSNQRSLWARFAQVEFAERYKLLLGTEYIDMIDTYSAGYRKEVFCSMGGFDISFPVPNNEDTDLSYRMSLSGHKMVFKPNAVVYHTGHPDTLQKYMRLKFWRGYWRMVVYERYTAKMIKDTYTPQTLKFQILFVCLFILSSALCVFSPRLMIPLISISLSLFLVASLPFTVLALTQDIVIGLLSPFFLFLRALSLGSGALYKLLEAFCRKIVLF